MRILYDGVIYARQVAGGINRYCDNLITRLPESCFPSLMTCSPEKVKTLKHPNLKFIYYKRFCFRPGFISYALEPYYFRAALPFHKFDLIHPTEYGSLTRQELSFYRTPIVLTVHDLIPEILYPETDSLEAKRRAILAAQGILCVSENTKRDLMERYPIPEERIVVTPLASELNISSSYGAEPVPDQPYFLFVGNRSVYKNFKTLLVAFSKTVSRYPDLKLCVVGPPFGPEEQVLIQELKIEQQIRYYWNLDDCHLAKLYRCSVALVYPSLYEGFGIPPLEAMACGTVAVTSNTSSLPEVVGDAGILFDPKNVADLVDVLLFLLNNPAEREHLIEKGQKRAKAFSWDKTVEQTVALYKAVVNDC